MISTKALHCCLFALTLFCGAANGATYAQDATTLNADRTIASPLCLARGDYPVGFMAFAVNQDGYYIEGGIWYPAQQAVEGASRAIYLLEPADHWTSDLSMRTGTAVDHAEPNAASGPYPLVIATYENVGQIYTNAYLHELLVSRGYIVMAVMHPFDNLPRQIFRSGRSFLLSNALDSLNNAELNKKAVIDYVISVTAPDACLSGMVDYHSVALIDMSPSRSSESQRESGGGSSCGMTDLKRGSTSLSPGC